MLVDFFQWAMTLLPFIHNGVQVYPAPTTFLARGETFSFAGEGHVFRILTPSGEQDINDPTSIEDLLEIWGHLALQQVCTDHTGVFRCVSGLDGGFSWFGDFYQEIPIESGSEEIEAAVQQLVAKWGKMFGEALVVKGFNYKGRVFIMEVGPQFAYDDFSPTNVYNHYLRMLQGGKLTVGEVLHRLWKYGDFLQPEGFSKKLAAAALDKLVKDTGGGSFVGLVDGTYPQGLKEQLELEPTGRMYRVTELDDLPRWEPVAEDVGIILTTEAIGTADRLNVVWTELCRRLEKWGCLKTVTLYLEGVSSPEEFIYFARKLATKMSLGVCISSWGQLLRLGRVDMPFVDGYVVDVDSLVDDGLMFHLHSELGVKSEVDNLLYTLLPNTFSENVSVLVTEQRGVKELMRLSQGVERIYTSGSQYYAAIMCLATSKLKGVS